ncbi:MAG: acylneuraminate cytidylyltransferase family protein [Gammaproteobacteria bacterium]|nr:MAG: acylneuraminate cytidylyltransferase family protein [Gammaproteobacteria bacterium]
MVGKCIAIIPARGGSKRIPRKNIIDFYGKPMIAWTIEAAQNSGCFDHILVSTDDQEIARVARAYGASVPFLRHESADDHSPVSQATLASLKQAEKFWGTDYETVVQLMPNCPTRTDEDIRQALNTFNGKAAAFQISCFKFGWMNPWWAMRLNDQGKAEKLFPEALSSRSQDLTPLFCPTGAIWIAQAELLKKEASFYGEGHIFSPLHWTAALDIDDTEDLEMAKAVFLLRQQYS